MGPTKKFTKKALPGVGLQWRKQPGAGWAGWLKRDATLSTLWLVACVVFQLQLQSNSLM